MSAQAIEQKEEATKPEEAKAEIELEQRIQKLEKAIVEIKDLLADAFRGLASKEDAENVTGEEGKEAKSVRKNPDLKALAEVHEAQVTKPNEEPPEEEIEEDTNLMGMLTKLAEARGL